MPTQRFNTSRRQILRTYTERAYYPQMFATNIPYGARDRAYGAAKKASIAEQIGQVVGEIGTAAASEALRLEELRLEMEAEAAREREETERARLRAQTVETLKSVAPWVVAGVVAVVVLPKIFKNRSA